MRRCGRTGNRSELTSVSNDDSFVYRRGRGSWGHGALLRERRGPGPIAGAAFFRAERIHPGPVAAILKERPGRRVPSKIGYERRASPVPAR